METNKLIEGKEKELEDLHTRMDNDANYAHLSPYILSVVDDNGIQKVIPGAISITSNKPATHLNTVQAWLMSAIEQMIINGDIADEKKTFIEHFSADALKSSDEMRSRRGLGKLYPFWATHICARGWIGTRWMWQQQGDDTYLDGLPCDVRWMTWEYGNDGLNWVNNKTFRSPSYLQKEYGVDITGTELVEVWDFWDSDKNEIWFNKKFHKTYKNVVGYPPFVITPAPEGFVLLDKGYVVNLGESIFFLNRGLFDKGNQLDSIILTMALKAVAPATQKASAPEADSPYPLPGHHYDYDPTTGGPYDLIKQADMNLSDRQASQKIDNDLKMGGMTDAEGGDPSPMPSSALLANKQQEVRERIQQPRLEAIQDHKSQSLKMIIDQYIKFKFTKFGLKGRRGTYDYKTLGDPDDYTVDFRLMSQSKELDIANASLAASLKGALPRITIFKDVIKSQDPEYQIALLDAEDAAARDPVIKMLREGYGLIDQAKRTKDKDEIARLDKEARRLAETIRSMRTQQRVNGFQPQENEQKADNSALSALVARGG